MIRYIFLLLFVSVLSVSAQNREYHISWGNADSANGWIPRIRQGYLDKNNVPVFSLKIPVAQGQHLKVRLENVKAETINLPSESGVQGIPADFSTIVNYIPDNNGAYMDVKIKSLRRSGSVIEKLLSFSLVTEQQASPALSRKSNSATLPAAHSVLAGGRWFKVGVTGDGIYKIDTELLSSMGIDSKTVNPNNVRVFGRGGAYLPEANWLPRPDDLPENPVKVIGGDDGAFNTGDMILFYGQTPHVWKFDPIDTKRFHHYINYYSDTTFYFIQLDGGPSRKISDQAISALSPSIVLNSGDEYLFHELEKVNIIKSGKWWMGESFDIVNSQTFPFGLTDIDIQKNVYLKFHALANATTRTSMDVSIGSWKRTGLFNYISAGEQDVFADEILISDSLQINTSSLDVNVFYKKNNPGDIAWLDFIEINYERKWNKGTAPLFFRSRRAVGQAAVKYSVSGVNSGTLIWNVSDPSNAQNVPVSISGSTAEFTVVPNGPDEFMAFNSEEAKKPFFVKVIPNQDLHGLPSANMLIIAPPLLEGEANRVADFHRSNDGYSVNVVNPEKIFNEYGGGTCDPTGIREFVKHQYNKSTVGSSDKLKFLLLFGDGSYDYKNKLTRIPNLVTAYESNESTKHTLSYTTDDYFALLGPNQGDLEHNDSLYLGVGRIPVNTVEEAKGVVNKILNYKKAYGDWRNILAFVCDDQQESGDHQFIYDTDQRIVPIVNKIKTFNIEKIYADAYKIISTPGGKRYPQVNAEISTRVEKGCLVINYVGHGGEFGWAHERILSISDIKSWKNQNYPLFFTATCEFSRFDDPERTAAGELVLFNPEGGGIALMTTVRKVYEVYNIPLNQEFYSIAFVPVNGKMLTIGEIYQRIKNISDISYVRNFTLLGDPALTLNYPTDSVYALKVNGADVVTQTDTIKGLSKVTISGIIKDPKGVPLTGFNGILYPTVYDKPDTLQNLANSINDKSILKFISQKNILYKGKASIKNGEYSFSFIVPKDIKKHFGKGKLSFYALSNNGSEDGTGKSENIIIGGVSANPYTDITGPTIKVYMNDEKFVFGGLTDANPMIYAVLVDSSGINTVGSGIGHDITANLDNSKDNIFLLNNYYESELDSYQKGKVKFPLRSLSEGRHTLRMKAWDVYDNSSEASTDFVVASSAELALSHVLNYPNPFTTHTSFYFEHNKPGVPLNVQVQVYTISGRLIKTINTSYSGNSYRSDPIDWDGKDDFGDAIGRGVYIYKLRVQTPDGTIGNKFEKLVILK